MSKFSLFHKINNLSETKKIKEEEQKEQHENYCNHQDVIQEKSKMICRSCGQVLSTCSGDNKEWLNHNTSQYGKSTRTHIRKTKEKTIFKDIRQCNFDRSIMDIANDTYVNITNNKIYRGRSRKAIIYACIMFAHRMLDMQFNNQVILKMFQIDKKSGLMGIRFLHKHLDKSKKKKLSLQKVSNALSTIHNIMELFNASPKQISEVEVLYEKIKNRSSKINRSRPRSIANALIFYWITQKKINIDIEQFSKKVNMSELTINKLLKEIKLLL